jgi:hypothetical protein
MKQGSGHSRAQDTHHKKNPPADTAQQAKDDKERSKHPASENTLESTQDKNPVPDESKRQAAALAGSSCRAHSPKRHIDCSGLQRAGSS